MRTTLNIDDDVLLAAKAIARRDKKTVGQVISEWGQITTDQQFSGITSKTFPVRTGTEAENTIPDVKKHQKQSF